MIAKSPDERYQSCEEIMRDLGNIGEKQTISVLKKEATVVTHPVNQKPKVSEQVTLPGGNAAITKKYKSQPALGKSKKTWLIAATLFAVVGAASVGYYKGYLPFPSNSETTGSNQPLLLADDNPSSSNLETQNNGSNSNDVQNSNNTNDTKTSDGPGLMAGLSDMFSNDDQKDVAQVDDSTNIDFPQDENLESSATVKQPGFQIDIAQSEKDLNQKFNETAEQLNANINSAADPIQTSQNNTTLPAQKDLVTVAHNTTTQNNGIVESKTTVPPIHVETKQSLAKQVKQQAVQKAMVLNKGVVVIAFGDPAVANPIEKIIESQLKQQGIKVMNEQFISGMRQLIDNGLDLAEMKNLIERNGGQAMVIANVNYVGSQELLYAGRSTELVNAQIDIDTYDIKTGDSIGSGFGSKIDYTSLNATDQASDVVMQFTDQLASSLKDKI